MPQICTQPFSEQCWFPIGPHASLCKAAPSVANLNSSMPKHIGWCPKFAISFVSKRVFGIFLDIIFVCNCLEQHSNNLSFYGWEANQVIVVTAGGQRKHQLSYSRSFGGRWLLKSWYLYREWKPRSVNTQLLVCTWVVFSFMLGYHVVIRLSFPFVTAATSVASLYSSVDRRLAGVQLFSVSNHLRRERLLRNLVKYVFVLSEQRKTIPEGKYS